MNETYIIDIANHYPNRVHLARSKAEQIIFALAPALEDAEVVKIDLTHEGITGVSATGLHQFLARLIIDFGVELVEFLVPNKDTEYVTETLEWVIGYMHESEAQIKLYVNRPNYLECTLLSVVLEGDILKESSGVEAKFKLRGERIPDAGQ